MVLHFTQAGHDFRRDKQRMKQRMWNDAYPGKGAGLERCEDGHDTTTSCIFFGGDGVV
jgi:hypothetical protein